PRLAMRASTKLNILGSSLPRAFGGARLQGSLQRGCFSSSITSRSIILGSRGMVANTCEADRVGVWAVANASPTEVTLFLSNLTADCTKSQLTKWMEAHGCMQGCDYLFVPRNFQTGVCLGYAFANFVDPACADRFVRSARDTAMRVAVSSDQGLMSNLVKWASGRVHHTSTSPTSATRRTCLTFVRSMRLA
ncbi:unnamed protein product, partial [Prorocentrum cordatum]